MAEDLTQLLDESASPAERERLLKLVYSELQSLARRELGARRHDQTLSTGPLVNEAYMKLFPNGLGGYENRRHFFGAAARAMRQVAVDYARARLAERRGNGQKPLNLDQVEAGALGTDSYAEELIHLDGALKRLAEVDERALQVAELRYFVGLDVKEIARMLAVSEATIKRDSRFVRQFLDAALRQ